MPELDTLGSTIKTAHDGEIIGLKLIQNASDLPAASGGVRTSDATTVYQLNGQIDVGTDRFEGSWHIFGVNPVHDSITYTGTGTMFTCTANQTINCTSIGLGCTNASSKLFDHAGGATGFIALDNTFLISVNNLGDIGAMQFFFVENNFISGCSAGFSFTGSGGGRFLFQGNTCLNNVGDLLGLGTAVFDSITINNQPSVVTPSGSNFLSGAAGSANVGIRALIESNEFSGAGDVLDTITIEDLKWRSAGNAGLPDTEIDASTYISSAISTTLVANTPTIILGTRSQIDANLFTTDAAGRSTYIGLDPVKLGVDYIINADPASGNNNVYNFYVATDGAIVTTSRMSVSLDNNTPQTTHIHALVSFVTGTYVEPWVESVSHTVSVTADTLTSIIN